MQSLRPWPASPALALASLLALSAAAPGAFAQDGSADAAEEAAAEDPVVAVVNGTELRRSDVVESARDLPQAYQDQLDQIFPALVDWLIDQTLLLEEGRRRNLQDDAQVKEQVALYEERVVREALVDRHLADRMTEEAVRARYDRFVAEFQPETEIHARHILVESQAEAEAVIAELDAGGDFAAIAKEKSTDTGSGANGGDLGFFTPEQMVPEFSAAAVALEPGSYSKTPVQSRFGWHVIKVEEKRETAPPSFEEARLEIENRLQQELVSEFVADLRADATIEKPAEAEAVPADPAAPPAEGGGEETPPVE